MGICVLGVDFRTAPVSVREQVALTRAQTLQLLHAIRQEKIFPEALVLSTCNRTEFYFVPAEGHAGDPLPHLLGHLAQIRGADPFTDTSVFFRFDGESAVRHLFSVAASLESQVVGEHEIMGQVREAYHIACEARTAKFLFHKLFHWAFRAGKRAMTETGLGRGTASVSQAAVDLAGQIFADLSGKTAMLVGAGQTAELAAQALIRAGVTSLVIANRTVERARQLAESFSQWHKQCRPAGGPTGPTVDEQGTFLCPALQRYLSGCALEEAPPAGAEVPTLDIRVIGLDDIPSAIGGVDLVISSTGAREPVLTWESLHGRLREARRSVLLIDIAVPRDIDPRLADLPNVYLYNIDGLETLVAQNIERRKQEIPRAQAIVSDELGKFALWLGSLDIVPTIKLLEQRLADLQAAEVQRYHRKFSEADRRQLQEFARALCAKIMHDPVAFLRQLRASGQAELDLAAVQTLRKIFNLDSLEKED